jgi:GT2 family glycosyltransferase
MSFDIVIPSARADNLVACVHALRTHEPELPPERIIVVDDGARQGAEAALPGLRWIEGVRPFNYARNINLALDHVAGDAILLNDDALLETMHGFSRLAERVARAGDVGLCSAGIAGHVGNARQLARRGSALRGEPGRLAFVCVYLTARARARVGRLDERFSGYGFEDDDYSRRVVQAGMRLAIWDGCVVRHDGHLPSTFRTRDDLAALFAHNRQLFERKWSGGEDAGPAPAAPDWHVRLALARAALPPAALDQPAFWYVAFHDARGAEIARLDADAPELRALLAAPGAEIVLQRVVRGGQPPAGWTVWPVDRRRRWLEKMTGALAADAVIMAPSHHHQQVARP